MEFLLVFDHFCLKMIYGFFLEISAQRVLIGKSRKDILKTYGHKETEKEGHNKKFPQK
jgi:hypothetical protein